MAKETYSSKKRLVELALFFLARYFRKSLLFMSFSTIGNHELNVYPFNENPLFMSFHGISECFLTVPRKKKFSPNSIWTFLPDHFNNLVLLYIFSSSPLRVTCDVHRLHSLENVLREKRTQIMKYKKAEENAKGLEMELREQTWCALLLA